MEILFQDEDLLVINKPTGLLTIRDGYNPNLPTVKSLLENEFGICWIVHRLDKETSGILLLARNKKSHRNLNIAFQNHEIHKLYHAIVHGIPQESPFTIDQPLKVDGDRKHRTVIDSINGKPAQTVVSILKTYSNYSLLSIQPNTGYTHQIRSHLSSFGHPILGDLLYYQKASDESIQQKSIITRTALHAHQLSFIHPRTNEPLTLLANYPPDFVNALSLIE